MDLIFLGDIHGNVQLAIQLANMNPDKTVIQIGDFGIGFIHLDCYRPSSPHRRGRQWWSAKERLKYE